MMMMMMMMMMISSHDYTYEQANHQSEPYPTPQPRSYRSLNIGDHGLGMLLPRDVYKDQYDVVRASSLDNFPNSLVDFPRTPVVLSQSVRILL